MNFNFKLITLFAYFSLSFALQCTDPKFSNVKNFVTKDAKINTETSYVVEFRMQCSNSAKDALLYTEVGGNILSSSTNEAGDVYQFSWTENHKTARTGDIVVKFYDEDGFTEMKRAQRNNENVGKVKELHEIKFNFGGSNKGPFIQYEYVIVILFGAIFYWALSIKTNIQA